MAYEMVMPYHLHMPSYFLETFTEYPIVEKMNGHIDVQSEVNKGSRFTAVLPYL